MKLTGRDIPISFPYSHIMKTMRRRNFHVRLCSQPCSCGYCPVVDCSHNWGIPWQSLLFVVISGSVLWGLFCSPFACSHFSLATGPGVT